MVNETTTKTLGRFNHCAKTRPVVDITGLHFTWSKGVSALLELEQFQVNQGEFLFIEGPSGSGKSTLLSILTGILLPQQGTVNILQHELSQLTGPTRDQFRADHIGYIFQMFNLIPYLSVVENVMLPCQFSTARKKKVLRQTSSLREEALRLLAHLHLKDPKLLEKPIVELSVGQQQRVAAARALIGSPEIIIADEPTSALDTDHRQAFLQLLFSECQKSGATLIFVSHDKSLAPLFNRVVQLEKINKATKATVEEVV